jgi:hypothetical protein
VASMSDNGEEKTSLLSFVEARRVVVDVPKRSLRLLRIDLVAEMGRSRATPQDFPNAGYPQTPINEDLMHPRWTFVVGPGSGGHAGDLAVWVLTADEQVSDEDVVARLANPADLVSLGKLGPAPASPPLDRPYRYGRLWEERGPGTGEQAACVAYVHPAPETGDVFDMERCFSAARGLTHAEIHSVWGSYDLDLVMGPDDTFTAPPTDTPPAP